MAELDCTIEAALIGCPFRPRLKCDCTNNEDPRPTLSSRASVRSPERGYTFFLFVNVDKLDSWILEFG
jgi:hypothetical protein